jgi:hypothetical protein
MDPVIVAADAAWTVASLALVFLLPGLTLGRAIAPGAMSPGTRLGRAIAVSMLTAATASAGLAVLDLLRPTILVALLAGATILPLHSRQPGRPRWPRGRARRWWTGAVLMGGFALALLLVPGWLEAVARGAPAAPSWEDVAAAEAMATLGGLPPEVVTWGSGRPFATNHLLATTHFAAAAQLLPGDILLRAEIYRVALLAAGLVVATMLFRRWVSSAIALLGAVLLLATVTIGDAFQAWDPLAWAVVIALFGLWLADRAVHERTWGLIAWAGVTGGAVLLTHPAVFLAWIAAVAGIAAARALVAPGGGPEAAGGLGHRHGRRLGIQRRLSRSAGLPIVVAAVIGGSAAIGGLIADGLLTGQPGVAGYLTGRTTGGADGTLTRLAELPAGWRFSDDATWDLARAAFGVAGVADDTPPAGVDRDGVAAVLLNPWPRVDGRTVAGVVLLLGLGAVAIVGWLVGDPRRQRAILATVVFGAALGLGALIVIAAADSFAGRELVVSRLLGFGVVVPVVAGIVGLWLAGGRLLDNWRSTRRRRTATPAALAVLAVATLLIAAPRSAGDTRDSQSPPDDAPHDPSGLAVEAYDWIAANLPDDARILVAAHTPGTVAVLAARTGIVDGPAYSPDDPAWPSEAIARLLGARRLFADPEGPGAAAFIEREAVDYLLVPGPGASGADLAGHDPFAVDRAALDASDRYALIEAFGGGRVLVYRVGG